MPSLHETVEKLRAATLELRAMVANVSAFNERQNMSTAKFLESAISDALAALMEAQEREKRLRALSAKYRAYAHSIAANLHAYSRDFAFPPHERAMLAEAEKVVRESAKALADVAAALARLEGLVEGFKESAEQIQEYANGLEKENAELREAIGSGAADHASLVAMAEAQREDCDALRAAESEREALLAAIRAWVDAEDARRLLSHRHIEAPFTELKAANRRVDEAEAALRASLADRT